MKRGIYRLTKDVENPGKVDRRKRTWYYQPSWKEGTLFEIFDPNCLWGAEPQSLHIRIRHSINDLHLHPVKVYPRSKCVAALRPHLVRVARTVHNIVTEIDRTYFIPPEELFISLVAKGLLTVE